MKFLIDADCPRSIGTILKKLGHQTTDIRDIKPSASDNEIYSLIQKESFILITRDTDFSNILRYPLYPRCGIVLLRLHLSSIDEIIDILKNLLTRVPPKDLMGSLTVVRKGRFRIRKF